MSAESWKLSLPCTRAEAEALNSDISALAMMEPPPVLMTHEPDEARPEYWEAHAYFEGKPDKASIELIRALIPSAAQTKPKLERLPDADWVTVSQQGLAPVHAGRFYIHTAANMGKVPPGARAFRIEASQAFGTGGHETTAGCLHMLDAMKARGQRFRHVVDIGTGTGLLAFAALELWPMAFATASDIDPVSIGVTAENAGVNGVALGAGRGQLALCVASGTDHDLIRVGAPYDLILANILAGPLIELAPAIGAIAADGATLLLAGLLDSQTEAVSRAYRSTGFRVAEIRPNGAWPCLRLVKRGTFAHRRPHRATGRTSQPPGDFGSW
jgi:ribosomal protein L11 methyltransferase